MLEITETGIAVERLNEIHDRLVNGFKGIYGQDIVVTPDSPDGQMIGLFSQALADINEVLTVMVQMLDPYQATGSWLEQRALYAGIRRREGSYSYLPVVVVTDRPRREVPEGTVLIDSNRNRWVTTAGLVLDENGSGRVRARSEDRGMFDLGENQSLQFEVMLSDSMRAETIEPSIPGRPEEKDPELLLRFMMSHAINNEDDREGIQAALLNIPEVVKALVLENDEQVTDDDTGLPPHSLNAIVVGGEDDDISLVLLKKKKGGPTFIGAVENIQHYKGMDRRTRFDRGAKVPITVKLQYERLRPNTDLGESLIADKLKARDFQLHENVLAEKLRDGVNSDSNFNLVSIRVNGGDRVDIGWREYAVITNVEIDIV